MNVNKYATTALLAACVIFIIGICVSIFVLNRNFIEAGDYLRALTPDSTWLGWLVISIITGNIINNLCHKTTCNTTKKESEYRAKK